MLSASVAITGATSASGVYLVKSFSEAGWKTFGLCSHPEEAYTDLKKERVSWLKKLSDVSFNLNIKTPEIEYWIETHRPQIWVHHHHHTNNYRSDSYDLKTSLQVGLDPLPKIVAQLKSSGCLGIIYSSSYLEPGEGNNTGPTSSYGQSKRIIGESLLLECQKKALPFSKIVIPNLVGPLENGDRLIPQLIKKSHQRGKFVLNSPEQVGDHLPLAELGPLYLKMAKNLLNNQPQIVRPSGWVGQTKDWVKEILTRLDLKVDLELAPKAENSNGNRSNRPDEKISVDWRGFWVNYLEYMTSRNPWEIEI